MVMPAADDRVLLLSVERELERLGDTVRDHSEDIAGDSALLAGVREDIDDLDACLNDLARRLDDLERRLDTTVEAANTAADILETLTSDQASTEQMLLTILAHIKARRS